jgi:hypothetical protein
MRTAIVCRTVPYDCRMHKIQKAAGQSTDRLTDLLTRRTGTGEITWDTGDAQRGLLLVSETRQNAGEGGDMRRSAHNPATGYSSSATRRRVRGQDRVTRSPYTAAPGRAACWWRAGRGCSQPRMLSPLAVRWSSSIAAVRASSSDRAGTWTVTAGPAARSTLPCS